MFVGDKAQFTTVPAWNLYLINNEEEIVVFCLILRISPLFLKQEMRKSLR